ncbi:PilT protein-like protein [Trichormus variabilis ATCC 29413]|uniref:PilT protein-like protein n=2 Tax=Anabaena variabilis TaxID=264691 RepID=Q3M7V5_TRIV2|nr:MULTISPECIES: type II toxin-antitoxin system VapC family toxin [Nostocaceae]ABA22931.1 PilT protein-like protein [Trichormus variabilis ATCC 29413]MBC1213800.1 type II toxin-antitoxin system VapC family toxin [Trichormus variabilis ARAD]MBC1257509.1 type II toxin-antitoxin system VapC family toxin [Trichormus variabilis V5]MBC1270458.1 type II toxin-antitoxin system VapC family toxin [Trichormus variabilis FSR]MBC1305260.1 type II toxin-antitoxin system VapC family toxin [Trichormus variabi
MEWLAQLQGQIVGLDTAPLIYFIEENPNYLNVADAFFEALFRGEFSVVTSVLTITEVLVYPLRQGNTILAQQYRDILLNSQGLTTIEVFPDIAETAAQLRANHNLRTPDAIQIATAIRGGASFFLTNDARLPSLPGLPVLVLEQLIV